MAWRLVALAAGLIGGWPEHAGCCCAGLSGALDTQCSQAWGAGQRLVVGQAYQRALLILTLLCIPVMAIWWTCTEPILIALEIGGDEGEGVFARLLCLGLWPVYSCLASSRQP